MSTDGLRVAVVGATGAVGGQLRRLLEARGFPVAGDPVFVASPRSEGRRLPWKGGEVTVRTLSEDLFDGIDIALFSAGSARSERWAPVAADAGAVVVDNSSAFRQDDDVPLVVTEVNPDTAAHRPRGIIANPNCTTMALMVPAKPLHDAFGLEAMVATSYQAAGGAGQSGIDELIEQTRELVDDPERLRSAGAKAAAAVTPGQFSRPIGFNVLAHCGDFGERRYTSEEWKLVNESRKILDLPILRVSPTCVRVPVVVGHAIAARMSFGSEVDRDAAVEALTGAPGLIVSDRVPGEEGAPADGPDYPTPLEAAGVDDVFVGRIREDIADRKSLNLWVVGDNLLKGAALNTVQIAELVAAGVV